jgi:hypothetical protein
MDQFEQEVERATKRAADRLARDPRAVAARYDAGRDALVISLSTGAEVSFPRGNIQGLTQASPSALAKIEITPPGYGLHFPKLDADLWVPTLLEGMFGSRAWMAAQLGAQGGKSTSEAKAQAARANGTLGGRPPAKKSPLGEITKRLAKSLVDEALAKRAKSKTKKLKFAAKMAAPLRSKSAAAKRKPAKRRA